METVIQAVKGFDKDMTCRGKQYAIGETYAHDGAVTVCSSGFHSCENPLDVFSYYPPSDSHYASVEAYGAISREANGDSKIASGSLRVVAEIGLSGLVARSVAWILARIDKSIPQAATNTGDRSAATNTGYQSAATNTG